MKSQYLRRKDEGILGRVVENYLKYGKPVSSGFISKEMNFSVASATVRNIMVKLEREEYLSQPHISSGRIPTDKGLRFYVNKLLEEAYKSSFHYYLHSEDIDFEKGDFQTLLEQVSRTLAEYSDNLGFVISPRISRINLIQLRFIKLAENRIMLILVSPANLVLTKIVETADYFTQVELDNASRFVNENFRGKTLVYIRDFLQKEVPEYRIKYEKHIRNLTSLMKTYFVQEEKEKDIFLQGASKLLGKPELSDLKKLKSLFQNFEERTKLAKLLSEFISLDRVKVLIGSELSVPSISECSLVLSHYGCSNQVLGSLGIIGPKRIPYRKIIPFVDFIANRLSQMISFDQ